MKELIAFIVMALVIAVLIEVNERRKAKKNRELEASTSRDLDNCEKKQACSDCGLVEICEKKPTGAR